MYFGIFLMLRSEISKQECQEDCYVALLISPLEITLKMKATKESQFAHSILSHVVKVWGGDYEQGQHIILSVDGEGCNIKKVCGPRNAVLEQQYLS